MRRRLPDAQPPDDLAREMATPAGTLLELPVEVPCETKDRVGQVLVRVLVRQILAELRREDAMVALGLPW